jgi:AcrR family transcriptional regulator
MSAVRIQKLGSSVALRRRPRQARGQRRVEQILRQSEAVFAEVGFEQATTNLIADRAGVSIGSLYQFFESKERILEALAEHYTSITREKMEQRLGLVVRENFESSIFDLLQLLISLQEQRPYFLQCLTSSWLSPVLTRVVEDINVAMTTQVASLLERVGVNAEPDLIQLRAHICVDVIGALLPLAVEAKGRARTQVVNEITALLLGYSKPMLDPSGGRQ